MSDLSKYKLSQKFLRTPGETFRDKIHRIIEEKEIPSYWVTERIFLYFGTTNLNSLDYRQQIRLLLTIDNVDQSNPVKKKTNRYIET